MNPLHLVARNYRCFADLDLALPEGCVAVIGENGAGKSSIVNAIDLTVFGARSLADLLTDTSDGEELLLELELEHAGELYRIRRTFNPKGRGRTTLDFERAMFSTREGFTDDRWVPLTCATTRETQELIEATFGLSRETFRASAFLAQGDASAFTDAQPRDRKRILSQVLGLDRYDHLQERARQDRRTFEAELQILDGKTAAAREQVEQKPAIVAARDQAVEAETELADRIADLEREHTVLAERFQEAREHGARRAAAEAELGAAKASLASIETERSRASVAAEEKRRAIEQLAQLADGDEIPDLEARIAKLEAAVVEYDRAHLAHITATQQAETVTAARVALEQRAREADTLEAAARGKAAALDGEHDATCDRCAQPLPDLARAHAKGSLLEEADAHARAAAQHRREAETMTAINVPPAPEGDGPHADLRATREQLAAIHETAALRERLQERIRNADAAIAAAPDVEERFALAAALVTAKQAALDLLAPVDLDGITRQGTAVRERLDANRGTLAQQRDLRARLDERLTQIAAAEETLAAAADERDRLQVLVDAVLVLERAFGRDGIPALIVENSAIPYLETEATQVLSLLGGKTAAARVELRTQAELKSGDGLRDTLDIVVVTEHDSERSYENWSGGEQMRINLALRVALAKLLAHGGAASGIFVIDEPDGLDATGKAALIDILRDMQGRGIERVYLISHDADLRDSFDTTLSVVDGRVDMGLEAVPA